MTETLAIGVDLGATKIASALIAQNGQVLMMKQAATSPEQGPQRVLDTIAGAVNELIAAAHTAGQPLGGIGLGSPGQIDTVGGRVRNAVNLGWKEVSLVSELRSRLVEPYPVWLQKDANASTLGEYYLGAGRGCPDFVYLSVGSGLGGGLLTAGKLVTGATGSAMEVGHISLDPEHGRLCNCGIRGCAETFASGPGLVAVTRSLLAQGEPATQLQDGPDLTPANIVRALEMGDPVAAKAVARVGEALGQIAAMCAMLSNPARVILGGGLGLAIFDYLKPRVQAEITRRVFSGASNEVEILASQLETSAAGPACLVWYGLDSGC